MKKPVIFYFLMSSVLISLTVNLNAMEKKDALLYGCVGGICAYGVSKLIERALCKDKSLCAKEAERLAGIENRLEIISDVAHSGVSSASSGDFSSRMGKLEGQFSMMKIDMNVLEARLEVLKSAQVKDVNDFGEMFKTLGQKIDTHEAQLSEAQAAVKFLNDKINKTERPASEKQLSDTSKNDQFAEDLRPI